MPLDLKGIYLGFDPGGERKFGVALLDGDSVRTSTVSSVNDAMKWADSVCRSRLPIAAGIDTLLHWATSKSGMRPCDLQLRAKYRAMKNSIVPPNSLRGAMAIGGMALALKLRQKWPALVLNETHPKVLLYALCGKKYDSKDQKSVDAAIQWFADQGHYTELKIEGEHQLDAALSAWATRKGLTEDWPDIIGEGANLVFPVREIRYLWPEAL
jgi:predicted nuclease with RNAse H fold